MDLKRKMVEMIDLNSNVEKKIIRASVWYHKNNNFWKCLAYIQHRRNRLKYNIEIYPECELGNIKIPHSVGIVIGRTAKIGDGTTIMPNVVVGAKYSPFEDNPTGRRHAIIGNNCMLGAGCKIIGNITIGNNVTVGANAIVTKDVPDNSIVYGINKIVEKK